MNDIRLIESFVAVVRAGSLTAAELGTGISKATLSRQISRLEAVMGSQLLTRGARRVQPTEPGRALYAHSVALLDEVQGRLEAARTLLHNIDEGVSGTLSVLSDVQFSTTFVCSVTELFLQQHPNVRCELNVAALRGAPSIDDVDCYVSSAPPERPNLVAKLLGRLTYSLFASPTFLAREPAPESPGDLHRCKAIVMRGEEACDLHSTGGKQAYVPSIVLSTNDYWVMKTLCVDGFGVALMPDFFAGPEVSRGVLVPILPAWRPLPRKVYCTYQRQRYMGRKVRAFVDLMGRCIADIDSFNVYVAAPRVREGGGGRRGEAS